MTAQELAELDLKVAHIVHPNRTYEIMDSKCIERLVGDTEGYDFRAFSPSTNPAQGWPLIVKFNIELIPPSSPPKNTTRWYATQWYAKLRDRDYGEIDMDPLIAAMKALIK